mmetsp:Transcript_23527/g.75013  ORF Transcript_23527/g.75013 Transcript_23527/m.75013 type:complete len:236 (-) Transcript_23527:236-943(-)
MPLFALELGISWPNMAYKLLRFSFIWSSVSSSPYSSLMASITASSTVALSRLSWGSPTRRASSSNRSFSSDRRSFSRALFRIRRCESRCWRLTSVCSGLSLPDLDFAGFAAPAALLVAFIGGLGAGTPSVGAPPAGANGGTGSALGFLLLGMALGLGGGWRSSVVALAGAFRSCWPGAPTGGRTIGMGVWSTKSMPIGMRKLSSPPESCWPGGGSGGGGKEEPDLPKTGAGRSLE